VVQEQQVLLEHLQQQEAMALQVEQEAIQHQHSQLQLPQV
jgi:hypothetical protein